MALSKLFADGEILTPADVNDHMVNHVPKAGDVYDTGWVDVTLAPGHTASAPVQVRRIGNSVYWRGVVGRTAGWTTSYTNVIPAANFPAGTILGGPAFSLNPGSVSVTAIAVINSGGLSVACNAPTSTVNLSPISYLVG